MKKRICATLAIVLLCMMLLSCGEKATESKSNAVAATDAETVVLRVCAESIDKSYLEPIFDDFSKQFEVELVCDWVPPPPVPGITQTGLDKVENRAACLQRLRTEIPAGKGPDVFVLSLMNGDEPILPDMMKAMRNGVFLDLNPLLAEKESNFSSIQENLLPAGQVAGRQYLLPLTYCVDGILLCDTPENNQALAARLEGTTLQEFLAVLEPLQSPEAGRVGIWWKNLCNRKEPAINYDTMQVDLFAPPIPELLRRAAAYQAKEAQQSSSPTSISDLYDSLACNKAGGHPYLIGSADTLELTATWLMEGTGTLFVPTPNADGEVYAALAGVGAIGAECKNLPQAQALLNFLLAEQRQLDGKKQWKNTGISGFPARKGLLPALFETPPADANRSDLPSTLLSGETLASFTSLEEKITGSFLLQKLPKEVHAFAVGCMEKSGEQLQDADIEAIQTKLELYLSE